MSAVLQQEKPVDMSVVLHMDEPLQKQIAQSEGALTIAQAFVIDSPEMAQLASDERRDLARRIDTLKEARKKFIAPAQEIIENAKALFGPGIAALEAARDFIGNNLLEWDRKEKARIAAKNAEREAQARKARQEAEAKAAAELARAEEIAAAERRKAAEAEEKRKAAEAEGNTRAAAAAAAEVAKANERAQAVQENAQAVTTETLVSAVAATPVAVAPIKIAGTSVRTKWIAERISGLSDDEIKTMIVKEIAAGRTDLIGLLALDQKAIIKQAESLKAVMRVPGFVAKEVSIIAGSRK